METEKPKKPGFIPLQTGKAFKIYEPKASIPPSSAHYLVGEEDFGPEVEADRHTSSSGQSTQAGRRG
jgi:hypothetical protein